MKSMGRGAMNSQPDLSAVHVTGRLSWPSIRLLFGTIWCLSVMGLSQSAQGQTVATAFANDYDLVSLGSVPGVPTRYGGLTFKAGDPNTLLIGGSANNSAGTVHAITVVRDANRHVTGFAGTSRLFANAPGLNNGGGIDGGLTYGPNNVLFYTSYSDNSIGQLKPGSTSPDKITGLSALGISSSVGSLMFVPPGQPGSGRLKILSYNGSIWYDTTATADGAGTFSIAAPSHSVNIGGGPEGVIYVPSGSPLFTAPSVLISEYGRGTVGAFTVNSNGDPIVASRRDFVTGLSGAEGAAVDPLTGDFLFSTFGGGDKVVAVRGFAAPPVNITISGAVKITEGNNGTTNATFTVTLSPSSTRTVTVTFATANGTATAGSDYTATSGTLTFPAGQTSKTITVPVLGDTLDEPDETFAVNLSNPSGGVLVNNRAEALIIDDDGTQTLSINDVTVTEGNSGTVNAVFRVSLSAASSREVTVAFATANGTATSGSDYIATSGTLTIPTGSLSGIITVPVLGDTSLEPNETFFVTLSHPVNATLADAQGLGTITNDDVALPRLYISNVSFTEGDAGSATMYFSVRLSRPATRSVTVRYATADGAPGSTAPATAGSDYTAKSGTLTFTAGQVSQVIQIVVQGDTLAEKDEQFSVLLSNPVGADIGNPRGSGTIVNDDSPSPGGAGGRNAPTGVSNVQPRIKASAADGTLTLRFAAPFTEPAAASGFNVEIDDLSVPVLGVESDGPNGVVTLQLPDGVLQSRDGISLSVGVTWHLQGADGADLQGRQSLIVP